MTKNPVKTLSEWITRHYSTRLMLALVFVSIGFFWLFNYSALPVSNPELVKVSGHEGLLDVLPYYTAQEAFTAMSHYGTAGRELYLKFLAADFVFIIVYSLGYAFLITLAIRTVRPKRTSWEWLNTLPICIGFFDSVENLFILIMLGLYPDAPCVIGTLSGVATLCKNIFTLIALISLASAGLILLKRRSGIRQVV
jgi:hypothetical protein